LISCSFSTTNKASVETVKDVEDLKNVPPDIKDCLIQVQKRSDDARERLKNPPINIKEEEDEDAYF